MVLLGGDPDPEAADECQKLAAAGRFQEARQFAEGFPDEPEVAQEAKKHRSKSLRKAEAKLLDLIEEMKAG